MRHPLDTIHPQVVNRPGHGDIRAVGELEPVLPDAQETAAHPVSNELRCKQGVPTCARGHRLGKGAGEAQQVSDELRAVGVGHGPQGECAGPRTQRLHTLEDCIELLGVG